MLRLIVILLGAVALVVYAMIEKRLNQRACLSCAYRVAADDTSDTCPRCGTPASWPEMNTRAKPMSA
jgi:predicted RNA-binding Zn-ribbon protein involved in translation (DUF1610 family)